MYLVRPIEDKDFDAFLTLAQLSGPGFTSLPDDPDLLKGRVTLSAKSFKANANFIRPAKKVICSP